MFKLHLSDTGIVPPFVAICYNMNVMKRPYPAKQLADLHKFLNKLLKPLIIREVSVIRTKLRNQDLCSGFPIFL